MRELFTMDGKCRRKIQSIFDSKYYLVYAVYDMGNRYLFGIKAKKSNNEEPLDPWYTINKKTLKIDGFLPHLEYDSFEKALANPINFK